MGLRACYQAALARSEAVAISDAEIRAARARVGSAFGAVAPTLNVETTETLRDPQGDVGGGLFSDSNQPEVAFVARQPLFHGLRNFHAMKAARLKRDRAEAEHKNAERLLFGDVAQTFNRIGKVEADIAVLQKIVGVMRESHKVLAERVDLGKARESELAREETDIALLSARLAGLRGDRAALYEALSFLTGLSPQPPIASEPLPMVGKKARETYLSAVDSRPDVLAFAKEAEASRYALKSEWGKFAPQGDASFTYFPYREGMLDDVKWQALFTFNLPVFNWTTLSAVREAKALALQADLRAQEERRRARSEVQKADLAVDSAKEEFEKYRQAVVQAERNARLQREDLARGLITPLDLLAAERTLLEALQKKNEAEFKLRFNWVALQIAAGELP